jgi:predicted Zn-dependent protease with MMP-like domain
VQPADASEHSASERGPAPAAAARVRRRDRHGRGLRGLLAPRDVPLYRSRAQRFDDLVLDAVARLEPRWEAELSGVEFAVEEIPDRDSPDADPSPVPLARLDPGSADPGDSAHPARPPRIVLYRRPLLARADDEDELSDLVFDVVVEEFAQLLGLDPETVDPGYADGG